MSKSLRLLTNLAAIVVHDGAVPRLPEEAHKGRGNSLDIALQSSVESREVLHLNSHGGPNQVLPGQILADPTGRTRHINAKKIVETKDGRNGTAY